IAKQLTVFRGRYRGNVRANGNRRSSPDQRLFADRVVNARCDTIRRTPICVVKKSDELVGTVPKENVGESQFCSRLSNDMSNDFVTEGVPMQDVDLIQIENLDEHQRGT